MEPNKSAIKARDKARTRVANLTTGTAIVGILGSVGLVAGFGMGASTAATAASSSTTSGTNTAALGQTTTNANNLQGPATAPTAAKTANTGVPSGGS